MKFLTEQLKKGLQGLSGAKILKAKSVIAYEPIWAIGAKKPCSYDFALSTNILIKSILSRIYNKKIAQSLRIIYGGSVKADNAKELFRSADIDGGLVGAASLKAEEFISICKSAG